MTSEQRLDRLERIAKLFVRAGMRHRRNLRDFEDKLNILINTQIKTNERFEERFARNEERFARNEERFARNEERLARFIEHTDQRFAKVAEFQALANQKLTTLAESQALTDRKLAELIDIIRKNQNGNRSARNN